MSKTFARTTNSPSRGGLRQLLLGAAVLLPCGSFWLAGKVVDDLPARVDGGGHLLRMRVEGSGSPAVVLEIGLGGPLEEWAAVQPEVAQFTQVVAYDRLGANRDVTVFTGVEVARELHAALDKAGVRPPYVLVGQSFGGIYNRIFASLYPDEVVGMVLLDPSQEAFIEWMRVHHPKKEFTKSDLHNWPEGAGILQTLAELKTVGPLPNVPIVVVSAALPSTDPFINEVRPEHTASNKRWVNTLPQGRHIVTDKSGHGVQVQQPELVIDLIRELVELARRRLDADSREMQTGK